MLSRLAREFAAEIAFHDWSDAHARLDRAGHRREWDPNSRNITPLTEDQTDRIRTNVMWVSAQVLLHADPNLNLHEYAEACGVPHDITHNVDGRPSGGIGAGIRMRGGKAIKPGGWDDPPEEPDSSQ